MSVPVYIYTDQTFAQKIRTQVIEFGSTIDISFGVGIRFNTPPTSTNLIHKISPHNYTLLTVGFADATFDENKITFRVLAPKNFFNKTIEKYTYSPNKIIKPIMNYPANSFKYTVLHTNIIQQNTPGEFTIKKTGNTIITANFPGVRNSENHTVNVIPADFTATISTPNEFQITPTNHSIDFQILSAQSIEDESPVEAKLISSLCSTPGITFNHLGTATITQANEIHVEFILAAQYYNNHSIHRTIKILKYTPVINITNKIVRYGDIFKPDITIDTPQNISIKFTKGHRLIGTTLSHIPYKQLGNFTALNTGIVSISVIADETPLYNSHTVDIDIEILPALKDYDVTLNPPDNKDIIGLTLNNSTINYIEYTNIPIPFSTEGETTFDFPPSISAEIIENNIIIHSIAPEEKYQSPNPQFTIRTKRVDPLYETVDKTYTVEIKRIPDLLLFHDEPPKEIVLNTEINDVQWVDIPLKSTTDYIVTSSNKNVIDAINISNGVRLIMRTANRSRIIIETIERQGYARSKLDFFVNVIRKSRSYFPMDSSIKGEIPGTGGSFDLTVISPLDPHCNQKVKGTATFLISEEPHAVLYHDDISRVSSRLYLEDTIIAEGELMLENGSAIDRKLNLSGAISGYSYYLQKMGGTTITANTKKITIQVNGTVSNEGVIQLKPNSPSDDSTFYPTTFNRELCVEFDVTDTFLPGDVIQFQYLIPSGFALYSYELVFDAYETSM